jgi:hypothetical protein
VIFTAPRAFETSDCEPTADSIIVIYLDHAEFGGPKPTVVRDRENCVVAEVVNDAQ